MARADVAAICAAVKQSTGVPYVYRQWPKGSEPEWPCIEYHLDGDANFNADEQVYRRIDRWALSLYSETKADALEEAIEDELDARRVVWTKSEISIESQGLIQVEYDFSLLR